MLRVEYLWSDNFFLFLKVCYFVNIVDVLLFNFLFNYVSVSLIVVKDDCFNGDNEN